ncbi:A-kinase anchor protein 9 isoform X2 [Stigmatopora nigra]
MDAPNRVDDMFRLPLPKMCRKRLAEYRQRKAYADSQRKKKKKKKSEEHSETACSPDNDDQAVGGQAGTREAPTLSEGSFAKTLRSGETIKHEQTYTIEPESEVSTTADDNSSEQVNGCREMMADLVTSSFTDFFWEEAEREVTKGGKIQAVKEALAAKSRAVEELSRELQDIRAAFGTEGVQKLQDFEAALKQRDGIITQLTANLQQARKEKDEIMREFLMLTEQSQKLQIQFQQLQAGEALRNTSHSSTAADLLQAKQQLAQYQLQLDEVKMEAGKNQEESDQQRELIGQLQIKISDLELSGRRSVESFTQKLSEKDTLIAQKEKVIMNQDQSLTELRAAQESLATTLKDKNLLLSEQTASLNLFREEVAILGQSGNDIRASDEKDLIIAEQERVISDRDCSLSRLEQELELSRQSLRGLQQRVSAKESELEKYVADLQDTKRDLESSKGEIESCKSQLEKARGDLQSCQSELEGSRQKERTSSDEIKQLMGTVEDLQRRRHRDSLTEGDLVQRMQQDADRKLDLLRAELDEMYGQQIVHMKQELNLRNTARLEEAMVEHQVAMQRQLNEAEVLKEQNSKAKETLAQKIQELQVALAQSASEFNREKLDLQVELQNLRGDLRSAKEKAQLASDHLISRENQEEDVRRLMVTVDDLQRQLAGAEEAAREVEDQHESETTNYKIKLEMLEREKDAVLDRMAESQEAELERLRTQLLFSHEEELTLLRQDLRREGFLNAENLLNEASVKHQKSLDDLRRANEEQVALSQRENAAFSQERQDLLRQIHSLKEDLEMASNNSRSDELEKQVQELQVELEVLRQVGDERARLENENQTLLKNSELLEEKERQWKDRQKGHDEKILEIERVASQLKEEMETQRMTFSLAQKNLEVNYQELKEEYSRLVDAKTQLEERTSKEVVQFQAQIAHLQSQAGEREGENVRRSAQAAEKASELMEKLQETLHEKESLAVKLSQVAQQLVDAKNETARSEEVTKTREDQIGSLRGEVQSLQALLKAAEAETDGVRPTQERAVEGRASQQKPAGSNRRKRRQRLKQERRASGSGGGAEPSEATRQKEEEAEEEEEEEEDESRATSAAESQMQTERQLGGHEADGPIKQDDCKLETEAQRISLTYIHAAQIELLQESSGYQKNSGHQDLDAIQILKAEALEKQRDLEESHRMEMESLQDRYSRSNAETEERCAAELDALRRQLEVLKEERSADSGLQSNPDHSEEHQEDLKDLSDEQLCQWVSGSSLGLSAKLQALRRALYNEYVQEVDALKEQHRAELSGLRQQLEKEGQRRDDIGLETAGVAGRKELLGEQRLEEEVAKAIVHMSVEYAHQTELARINKLAGQTSVAMQTPSDGEQDAQENAPDTPNSYLNEERSSMEKEPRDRNGQIQPLQVLEEKVEDEDGTDENIHKDSERTVLRRANERLSRVLTDILKTTAAAEETMGLHMQSLQPDTSASTGLETSAPAAPHVTDLSGKSSPDDDFLLGDDEDHLMGLGARLQTALEKMLMVITDTTNQVEHARITQTELMRESFRHNQEISELLQKQEELQERLAEEARAREQLAIELHRAEGVIDGYTGERAALEEQLRQKEELQLNLEQDLQVTASRLQELEQERLQMQEERELVSRQQDAMRGTAGPRELCLVEAAMVAAPEADLLEETEKLMKEKVEVQRQAEKESADLLKQMKVLEAELEEQVNRVIELEQASKTETGDLQQQIQALEKQLDKNRRFLDEQAVDREHERDVFQNEIQELERQLKNPQKLPGGSEQRSQQVEQLNSQLKEKADRCSELLLGSEQLRREQSERDQEIDKLESRVRELEQALLVSAESLEKDEENRRHASITEAKQSNLEAQLHTEREALERKEKEICHLEEQLEQFREELENKNEEVQQLHMQLEIQRKEICSQQQFLETRESMLQVMEEKDRAIALLNEQNSKLQHLEKASGNKGIDRRDALINDLESQVECFKSEQERLKRNNEEELEQLNSVIEKLQQELVNMERKEDVEAHAGEQYDEMKQRMDTVTGEFSALKLEHAELLEIHQRSKESGENSEELSESLRQRTASLLVAQAQVKALEKSAASNVDELQVRIRELENQNDTQVREKVASEVVNQITLEALQKQISKDHSHDKVRQLNQKLGELETSLGGIERNDKHRKQLLSRSREELADYERRLVALVDLMRLVVGTHPTMTEDLKQASVAHQALLSDLQQAKEDSLAAKKQLDHHEEECHHLREQLKDKTGTVDRLKEQLEKASSEGAKETQALREELAKTQKEAMVAKEDLSSCKENLEKLQDLLEERELTIAGLKEDLLHVKAEENNAERTRLLQDLQEVQSNADASKDQVDSYKSQNERLNDDIKKQELSISELQDELRELQKNLEVTREEVSSYKSHNEKLQEDIQHREVSISKLKEELQEVRENHHTSTKEVNSYKSHIVKLQEDVRVSENSTSRLEEKLKEVQGNMDTTKEELDCYKSRNEKLNEEIQQQKVTISKIQEELLKNLDSTNEQVSSYKSHNEKLIEEIQQQKVIISQLEENIQKNVESTDEQLSSYKSHNEKLKMDVQVCEESILKLKGELQVGQKDFDSTKEELDNYKSFNEKLQDDVEAREISISKLKEDLQEVNKMVDSTQELKSYKSQNEKLQEDLQVHELSITKLKQELQESQKTMESTKEELESYKSHNEKIQEEIQSREATILNLKVELQELQKNVDSTLQLRSAKSNNEEQGLDEGGVFKLKKELQELKKFADTTKEELRNSKSHNEKLKVELREARAAATKATRSSSSASPSPVASPQPFSSSSQTKRKASGKLPLPKVSKEKATPLSRKAITPSASPEPGASDATTQTAADEDLIDVVGEFREKVVQMRELHAAEILDMEARHISESDALRRDVQHLEEECKTLKVVIDKLRISEVPSSRQDRPQSLFKDGYTNSSSDYSQRTGCDHPGGLQQEFRATPEGAGRDADDSALPDRIKSLLREVHQEGMQVLSLSDLPVLDGDPGGTSNVWLKQRDALFSTVESLKGLIAHMQTKQMSGDSADWRAELLEAVRQVFVKERGVLKSTLYGQLDMVDTSDAVIHLNQLELKIAEQDAQHKEAMSSLHDADRSSLMAEIYHLRVQLDHLHQGARPTAREQRGGGDADGAGRNDRLLLEELKGELSQTKLELETMLMSQHKHLKELDTLRAEVSQKASEVDVLNEQLLEESRKGRELQWTVEKERCRAGRSEENAQEQLEDLNLALEEQKNQAEQLTAALEQERQESARLCQQAEKEKLGLQRRLQELRVQLETEQSKSQEMRAALDTAKELRLGGGSASQQEDILEELHNELDDKQAQVLDLLGEIEAAKLEVLRKDQELNQVNLESKQSHEALLDVQARLERVESRLSETRNQLATEESRRRKLQEEKKLEESSARDSGGGGWGTPRAHHQHHHGPWRTADAVLGKLHLLASKIRGVACDGAAQITEDELSLLRSSVDDVISMLQQSPGLPSINESAILLAGGSSSGSSLTERLLRQNAELTGFVGRLTEEKNDLRNQTLSLEEQLRCCRHAGDTSGGRKEASGPDLTDMAMLTREKETWSQEKVRLEKALDQALAQVARLKGEMRSEMLREITGPEADNALLKKMYGRYLRSESFRKALIYQKKYLLLLLGGFQECEEATLALLSRMGGRPLDGPRGQRGRGLTRFRSAVRVSIALSRMRFLVKRWHKTTGTSNICCISQKSDTTRIIGTDERDHLHPGVDVFRERGGSSSRGRSGRESPRSPGSAAQHRFHAAGDQGMLTCSHLQSYDPDRALTDYISRLEALQRRLGSVTPGASSSLAPLHFSLRR